MREFEIEYIRIYSEDRENRIFTPQDVINRRNDYIMSMESLVRESIEHGEAENSVQIRADRFKIEALKMGWPIQDMPFLEKMFLGV